MRGKCSVLVVVGTLVLSVAWGQQGWVDLGNHGHTNFSDGTSTFDDLLARFHSAGHQLVGISDHAEMINSTHGKPYQSVKEFGVNSWVSQVASYPDIVPGVECGLGVGRKTHVLFYGGFLKSYPDIVSEVEKFGENNPREALRWLRDYADINAREAGTVLIAAHPVCVFYPFTQPFDLMDGVEVFDGITSDPVEEIKTIARMRKARQKPLAVITGSDFHGMGISRLSEAVGDTTQDRYQPALERRTFVHAISRDGVPRAIRDAECYAVFQYGRIVSTTAWPGGKQDPNDIFKLVCTKMNRRLGDSAFVLIVGRNGKTVTADAPMRWSGSETTLLLDLRGTPRDVIRDGAFMYLLIAGQLATSGVEVLPYSGPPVDNRVEEPVKGMDDIGNMFIGALIGGLEESISGGHQGQVNLGKVVLNAIKWALVDQQPGTGTIIGGGGGAEGGSGEKSAAPPPGGLMVPTTDPSW